MRKLLALGVAAALLVLAIWGIWVIQGWHGSGPSKQVVAVVIPRGTSLPRAAALLEKAGAISSSSRFLFQAKMFGHGRGIKAGEYEFPAGASDSKILWMLENGKTLQRFVIVPEGLPSIMVWERLMKAPELTGDRGGESREFSASRAAPNSADLRFAWSRLMPAARSVSVRYFR